MQIIDDGAALARALHSPLNPALCRLLTERLDQLLADTGGEYELAQLARFVLVEPGDTIAGIEAAAGYPVVAAPAFEWVLDHGGIFEAAVILSDDGYGSVLLVPNAEGVPAPLLDLLRDQTTSPHSSKFYGTYHKQTSSP
jgi:hypothetical protein